MTFLYDIYVKIFVVSVSACVYVVNNRVCVERRNGRGVRLPHLQFCQGGFMYTS